MGGEEMRRARWRPGEEKRGSRRPALGPDTYSGTTCLICGFTYPSTALAAEGGGVGMVMRTKVTESSQGSRHCPMQSDPLPTPHNATGLIRDKISHRLPLNTC